MAAIGHHIPADDVVLVPILTARSILILDQVSLTLGINIFINN